MGGSSTATQAKEVAYQVPATTWTTATLTEKLAYFTKPLGELLSSMKLDSHGLDQSLQALSLCLLTGKEEISSKRGEAQEGVPLEGVHESIFSENSVLFGAAYSCPCSQDRDGCSSEFF